MSRELVDRFTQANRDIRRLATRDLRAFWLLLPDDPTRAAAATVEFMPDLVGTYGDVAATAAADYYDALRTEANIRGGFRALLAPGVPVGQVQASTRWAMGPLFGGARQDALKRATQVADRLTLQTGRDTIDRSTRQDSARPRYARVPQGATCAFCLMLASRGPVYGTARDAGQGNVWHADCDCTPTPIYDGQPLPDGYDPEALYDRYLDAREQSGSHKTKTVLSELRQLEGTN